MERQNTIIQNPSLQLSKWTFFSYVLSFPLLTQLGLGKESDTTVYLPQMYP